MESTISMIRLDGKTRPVGAISHTTTRQKVKVGDRVMVTDKNVRLLNVAKIITLEYDQIKQQNIISLKMIE